MRTKYFFCLIFLLAACGPTEDEIQSRIDKEVNAKIDKEVEHRTTIMKAELSRNPVSRIVCSYQNPATLGDEGEKSEIYYNVNTFAQPIGFQISSYKRFCSGYGGENCEILKQLAGVKELCLSSPERPKYVFTFYANDLKTGDSTNAEFYSENCGLNPFVNGNDYGKFSSDVAQVRLTATPTTLSFANAHSTKFLFNIQRDSLQAGYEDEFDFMCTFSEVELNDNKI